MSGWEMFVFVTLVVGAFAIVVALAWFIQWRRNPNGFRESWRRSPLPGSSNDWRRR